MKVQKIMFTLLLLAILGGVGFAAGDTGSPLLLPPDEPPPAFPDTSADPDYTPGGSGGNAPLPPGQTSSIQLGLCELYTMVNQLLAVVVFVLIVVAAIIYAAGQVMGAETRARASVWATSMIVGAVIGIVIYLLVPIILDTMLGADMNVQQACISS